MIDIGTLRAAGLTDHEIVRVVEAERISADNADKEKKAARREKNRIYQQNHRSRQQCQHVSALISDVSADTPPPPSPQVPLREISNPSSPPSSASPPSLRSGLRTRGSRLPADWLPSESDLAFAEPLLGPRVREEAAKFRDYWSARADAGAVKLDWPATWRNWCRKAANDHPARAGPIRKPTLVEVADDLLLKMRAFDEPAPRIRDGTSEGIIRRLPSK